MTSFDTQERSIQDSRPVELYEFTAGSTVYRYTSAEDDIVIGANTFQAIAIARGDIEQGSDQSNRNLVITTPSNLAVAQLYVNVPPGEKTTVNVYRYQRDEDPAFDTEILQFQGTVQSVRFPNDGYSAEFALRSVESSLNRNIPRFTFAGMCQNILYDDNCGAVATDFDHIGAVSAIDGNFITVTGLNASGLDFVGGYVRPTGQQDFRMVIAQSGDDLELLLPFADNPTGTNVQAFAGCDHLIDGDCALVFDRVADFIGFAFVPNKDVFSEGI